MPNYIGMKSGDVVPRMAGQQLSPKNLQSAFNNGGNNLQSVEPKNPIVTKVQKRVGKIDGFGTSKSSVRPIRTTAGIP